MIEKLAEHLSLLPGIGPRQAKRIAYFLAAKDTAFLEKLSELILKIKANVQQCPNCFRFFETQNLEENICDICSNINRDKTILLVIEKDVDFLNIEKIKIYNGLYFIIGGVIPLTEIEPSSKIRIKELFNFLSKNDNIKEVVLATSATAEGENTASYIIKILEPLTEKTGLKITTLGRGLSTGTELEYSDTDTIQNALKNRK